MPPLRARVQGIRHRMEVHSRHRPGAVSKVRRMDRSGMAMDNDMTGQANKTVYKKIKLWKDYLYISKR